MFIDIGRSNNLTGSVGLQSFRPPFLSSRPFQRTIPQPRLNNARGFLGPVGFPLRISTSLEQQQISNVSNRLVSEESMDTSVPVSQSTTNINQSNTNLPQSLNLGQALSEFMTLASQCILIF